jgi:type IV secretory pathway VirB2 component (pilin)
MSAGFYIGISSASASLADPPGSSVIVAAVSWLEGTMLGTVATSIAVVAIASVGFMMLWGRFDVRRGITVVVGSFILFGASSIAAGIQSASGATDFAAVPDTEPPIAPPAQAPAAPPPAVPANRDPYAGAAVPTL